MPSSSRSGPGGDLPFWPCAAVPAVPVSRVCPAAEVNWRLLECPSGAGICRRCDTAWAHGPLGKSHPHNVSLLSCLSPQQAVYLNHWLCAAGQELRTKRAVSLSCLHYLTVILCLVSQVGLHHCWLCKAKPLLLLASNAIADRHFGAVFQSVFTVCLCVCASVTYLHLFVVMTCGCGTYLCVFVCLCVGITSPIMLK